VLNELFAALLAETFDPDRLARAMGMTPADYERIEKLHARLISFLRASASRSVETGAGRLDG
jgi:hypothetical protein